MITSLLLILEALSLQEIVAAIVVIAVGFFTLKTKIFKDLTSSSKELIEVMTKERDDLKEANKDLKNEIQELKEEIRMLRRENIQRGDINSQDRATIRALQEQLRLSNNVV